MNMSRDALYRERMELTEQIRGLPPGTSTYEKINTRLREISSQLGGNKVSRSVVLGHEKTFVTGIPSSRETWERKNQPWKYKRKQK